MPPEVSMAWRFLLAGLVVGVMVPVVALILSTLFEHLEWNPLMIAGMVVSVAGNVLVLRSPADTAG